MAVALALTVVPNERSLPRPCCPVSPINGCQFRPALVRAYLFTLRDSRLAASRRSPWTREDWIDYLADRLRGDAEAENLLVQKNRGDGGLLEKARDIVLSLERARDELGIQLVFGNTTRLAAALCRFACDGGA